MSRRATAGLRLGVLGGTFNPIHLGHLRSAEEIAEALHLDRVLFIPSSQPPHKQRQTIAAAAHRLAMVRLATGRNPRFRASSIEIDRSGRSYSVDTLEGLRQRLGHRAEIFFILGYDAFTELATWKNPTRLFDLAHLVIISRPPAPLQPKRTILPIAVQQRFCYLRSHQGFVDRTGQQILFRHVTALDISASDIRARIARGQSVRYLVPATVERYIRLHRLYGPRARHT